VNERERDSQLFLSPPTFIHFIKMTQSIVVIGGGIIGVTTAYYTARLAKERGLDLTIKLIEGSAIAAGSSGKAGGLLAIDWHGELSPSLSVFHSSFPSPLDSADVISLPFALPLSKMEQVRQLLHSPNSPMDSTRN